MKITRFLTAAILASSAALVADDGESKGLTKYIGVGFALAHGHAHDMTQKTWGGLGAYAAEFGVQFRLPQTDVYMRPNLGMARLLAGNDTETHPNLFDMVGIYLGFDVVYPFKSLPLSLTTGPSFHSWNVDRVNPSMGQIVPQGDTDVKLGWRLGATYTINDKCSVTLDYTLTEWRKQIPDRTTSNVNTPFVPGFNPSRPTYFTIKASYGF